MRRIFSLGDVASADLYVDAVYEGGADLRREPLHAIFKCGIGGGFRYKRGRPNGQLLFVVLFSTQTDPDWPDRLDSGTGVFTYYGDNRSPGPLHETKRRGNRILANEIFGSATSDRPTRERVPPVFVFTRGDQGHDVVFRGLAVPGATGVSQADWLVAVWRSNSGARFQNYRAIFSILDTDGIRRTWLDDLLAGRRLTSDAPGVWRRWVETGVITPLRAVRSLSYRNREEQLAMDERGKSLVKAIYERFRGDWHGFEKCAAEIFRLVDPHVTGYELTRPWRDGGRDAMGLYRIGTVGDAIDVEFALEAKCYGPDNSVGVKGTSRLISRLRHRQFGVLVTTSFLDQQAYKEIKEDGHPVLVVAGVDIARILVEKGYSSRESIGRWLDSL